ncbi:MAG: hypothetical protein M1834_008988 [Cirrosporium novae-zelandiae]|nr:MAG: hypothetical protein M1834_008988 [Cirrosporium novae-zelandiae]
MSTDPVPELHFPRANPTLPFWRTQLDELDDHRTTPDLPAECDILIIGAGFSGAATAYNLFKDREPGSVVILEARQACSGATGRNGGHLKPDVYFNVNYYVRKYGAEAAAELANFEASQVLAVKQLVEDEEIDCDFNLTRAFDVHLDEEHAKKTKAAYDELRKTGIFTSVKDVHYVPSQYAEQVTGVKNAKGGFSFTAGHVWPYKMVLHLLRLVISRGANLQTTTPVTSISETPDSEDRWTINCGPRGAIKTKKLIIASNAYTSAIAPQYSGKIVPVRGICSHITVPEGKKAPHLPSTYSVRYGPGLYDYQITRPDGTIVVGGARTTFLNDESQWYNVSDDTKLIEPAKNYYDGYMQRTFTGWENTEAYTDKLWTGIMGYTTDMVPHVGAVPSKPNQFILAGFNGHGMPLIFLTSKAVAEMVYDGKAFEETSTKIPSFFKTTKDRLLSDKDEILRGS